ncbi:hypothetical protein [Streptomyces sp. YIM S03343]
MRGGITRAARLPFSTDTADHARGLPLQLRADGRLVVPGGAVLGLAQDDVVDLTLPGEAQAEARHVEVTALHGADAELGVPVASLEGRVPGYRVVPVRTRVRRYVAFDGDGPLAAALRPCLASSAGVAEAGPADEVFATVRSCDSGVVVTDRAGLAFRAPVADDPAHREGVLALLEELARGERLRAFPDGADDARLGAEVTAFFERLPPGRRSQPLFSGGRLGEGDHYHVRVVNHSQRQLFLWLLDVGLSGRTALVTDFEPSGCLLNAAGSAGAVWNSGWIDIYWPGDVPREGPRPETLIVLVADREADLLPLATFDTTSPLWRESMPLLLRSVAAEILGGVRICGSVQARGFRYKVLRCAAEVVPRRAGR